MIERLTKAQTARFPEYVERWTKIGLCTEPMDRERAKRAICSMYTNAGLSEPKVAFCGSPFGDVVARRIALSKPASVVDSVVDSVRASVWSSVRDSVGNSVRDSVWSSVRDSVWSSVGDSVRDSVRSSVWDSVWSSVRDSVRDSVWSSVWDSVGSSVRDSVRDSVWSSVWDSVGNSVRDSVYGQHDADWLSFYAYFRDVCGPVEQTEPLVGLFELAKSAGWALPCERICWVSERHDVVQLNAEGRLHCNDGPAIHYPDGWSIYALNGVRVPEWLVETKAARLDARKFAELDNAEIRREFVRKVGIERIVTELGAEVLDRRGEYELLSVDLGGQTGKWPYLKMRNPSIGVWHLEAVVKECATVEQALNWRNGDVAFEHIAPMT